MKLRELVEVIRKDTIPNTNLLYLDYGDFRTANVFNQIPPKEAPIRGCIIGGLAYNLRKSVDDINNILQGIPSPIEEEEYGSLSGYINVTNRDELPKREFATRLRRDLKKANLLDMEVNL